MIYIYIILSVTAIVSTYEAVKYFVRYIQSNKNKKHVRGKYNKEENKKLKGFILLYLKYCKLVQFYELKEQCERFMQISHIKKVTIQNAIEDLVKSGKIKKINRHNVPPSYRKVYYYSLVW